MNQRYAPIIEDYRHSGLSVRQIASKHGVCVRTVYNAIAGKTDRKGWQRQRRRYLALTRDEAQALLDGIGKPQNPVTDCVTKRLETIVEDLSY